MYRTIQTQTYTHPVTQHTHRTPQTQTFSQTHKTMHVHVIKYCIQTSIHIIIIMKTDSYLKAATSCDYISCDYISTPPPPADSRFVTEIYCLCIILKVSSTGLVKTLIKFLRFPPECRKLIGNIQNFLKIFCAPKAQTSSSAPPPPPVTKSWIRPCICRVVPRL